VKNQIDRILTDRLSDAVGALVRGYLKQPPYPRAKVFAVLNALNAVEGWLIARTEDPDQLTQWAKDALDICVDVAKKRYSPSLSFRRDHLGGQQQFGGDAPARGTPCQGSVVDPQSAVGTLKISRAVWRHALGRKEKNTPSPQARAARTL
jgi:hypothetical protein